MNTASKKSAPVLRLVTRRESTASALSVHQKMVLERLEKIRQMVLDGKIDSMLYYASGMEEVLGMGGGFACRGIEGDMDFVMAGMFLRCAIDSALHRRL